MSKTYTIRPLVWECDGLFGEHRPKQPWSNYCVRKSGSDWEFTTPKHPKFLVCDSLEDGKAKCEEHYVSFISQALEGVD